MSALLNVLFSSEAGGDFQTHSAFLPETAEIIYGGIASVLVIGALIKFALPMITKSLRDRTTRIQTDIDNARNARAQAEVEAGRIRTALGDIDSERAKILAEADAQAQAVITEGRARVAAEMVEIENKAMADIANASGRVKDELESDIKRLSRVAVERIVADAVNDSVRQGLIEDFITNVGAAR